MYSAETLAAIKKALGKKRGTKVIPPSERITAGPPKGEHLTERERLELAADPQLPGTLPERIVRKWLAQSGLQYYEQQIAEGGHLRIGGAVIDFIVYIGAPPGVACRIQGSYWHLLPDRVAKDFVQANRLRAKGYRIFDAWEGDVYDAVLNGYLNSYLTNGLYGAT